MMKVIKDGDVFEITQQDEHKRVVVVQPRPGVAHLMLYRPASCRTSTAASGSCSCARSSPISPR